MQSGRYFFPPRTTGHYIIACIETMMESPAGLSRFLYILRYLKYLQPKEWKKEWLYFLVWVDHIGSLKADF